MALVPNEGKCSVGYAIQILLAKCSEPYKIYKKSYYLLGRDRKVADIPLDHPSCSKQHAVIQFRVINREDPDTLTVKRVNR